MSKILSNDNDLLKICHLEKRMRNSDQLQDPSKNAIYCHKLDNSGFQGIIPESNFNFDVKELRESSFENNNVDVDKENEIPLDLPEEEKNEFSLQNYLNLEKSEEKKIPRSDTKRKPTEPLRYYPIFKKIKIEEMEHKMFIDEKIGYSENSNEGFHLNSIKNNRKITEYFKKQKTFVQNLIKNDALRSFTKEDNNNIKTVAKTAKNSKENFIRNVSLRKISFGESNSNTEFFHESGSQDKKIKEKEKAKQTKNNQNSNSSEKISNENFKLKDEIRKLNKKLVDKDAMLKNEETHLRHLIGENKVLSEKVQTYEQQIATTQKSQQLICKLLLETEKRKKHELKNHLITQKQRLGEFISQRQGHKFMEVWVDGYELRSTKEKLNNIKNEREQIEKARKNIKVKKNGTLNPFCIFTSSSKNEKEKMNTSLYLNFAGDSENPDSNSLGEPHIFDVKNRLSFKNSILLKEEQNLLEEVKRLENEKINYIYQTKLYYEEEHCRFSKPDPETNFLAWPFINTKYQILSLLGKGGFSEVYKAFDVVNYMEVACKMHHLNSSWSEHAKRQYVKHALRENEIHNSLKHPNIVKLYETFEIDSNTICTVLEFCEGPDLSQYMKQYKFLPEKDAKCILKQIIAGLRYLHENKKKIIHYDLKPQNIIFHRGEIKISDFGLCKIMEDNVTRVELTSQGVGTYWYLPPECFEIGESPPNISTKVDIWSLGVIFFEMLFGEKPFGQNMSQERILKEQVILHSDDVKFPNKPSISNECKEFISSCLIKDPEKRWDINGAINSFYLSKK